MELKQVRCTTCGFPMEIDITAKQHTCGACGNSFISNIAQKLSENQNADIDVLKNSRINLDRSISSNDLNAILHFTNLILGMIPEDFIGLYYNAYAASKLTNPKALHSFLKKHDYEATDEDIQEVIEHLAQYSDLRDRKLVIEFVNKISPLTIDRVNTVFNKRIQKENDYAVVKRDIFICHRSTDKEEALRVLDTLESDGYTCWISYRNLRPDDNENYWKNIEQAIKHCDIFLVVSSQDAMLSKDVQTEIQIASERKMKRLEYKIDNAIHTTLFKHFFNGLKWVNAIGQDGLEELKLRVYDLSHVKTLSESKKIEVAEPLSPQTNIEGLIKRAYFEVSMGKYEEALQNVDKIFDIDIENADAWIIKLLIAEELLTIEGFYENLKKASHTYFDELMQSEAYQALTRFNSSHEVVKRINEYRSQAKERYAEEQRLEEEQRINRIKKEKEQALNGGNTTLLERLAGEYREPVKDSFYLTLIRFNIYSLYRLKDLCSTYEDLDEMKRLFEHPDIKDNLDDDIIKSFYEKHLETQKSFEAHLQEQASLKEEEQARLSQEIEIAINEKDFVKASEVYKGHHELLKDSPRNYLWAFCLKYKVSSINELAERSMSIHDKRGLLKDELINQFSSEEIALLQPILDVFSQEVKEYDLEQLELTKLRNKKRLKIASILVVFIGLIISGIVGVANAQVHIDTSQTSTYGAFIPESIPNHELPFELPIPTRSGHTFLGWYENRDFSGDPVEVISPGLFKSYQLHAKWEVNRYRINFMNENLEIFKSIDLEYESFIPTDIVGPEKMGHSFIGWEPELPIRMEARDKVFVAIYIVNSYSITFNTHGGTQLTARDFGYNWLIFSSTFITQKEGHTFMGWYLDEDYKTPLSYHRMPAYNLMLNAKWELNSYDLEFRTHDGTIFKKVLEFGSDLTDIELPNDLTREGYTFTGWSEKLPDTMPSRPITINAQWEKNSYSLTIKDKEGNILHDEMVEFGRNLTEEFLLSIFDKEGHTFLDWDGEKPDSMPASDLTLTTKWQINMYTLVLENYDGSELFSDNFEYNAELSQIELPSDLTREGHTFEGWSAEIPDTMPASDLTIVTQWQINSYALVIEDYDGTVLFSGIFDFSDELSHIELPTDLTREGHAYLGLNGELPNTMPARDLTLTTQWQTISYTLTTNIIAGLSEVIIGDFRSAGLTSEGQVFTWGNNSYGQLGDGTTTNRLYPTNITSYFNLDHGERVVSLSLGSSHSIALTSEGRVFTWGRNNHGQLGDGTTIQRLTPTEITNSFNLGLSEKIIALSLGNSHSIALTSEGQVFTWGRNGEGQLGDGTIGDRLIPINITNNFNIGPGERIIAISLGSFHSSALTTEGRIFTWGLNRDGRLGDGTVLDRLNPTDITSSFNLDNGGAIISISMGGSHSSALTTEGRVFTWGLNSNGRLGDGTTTNRLTPTNITDLFFLSHGEKIVSVNLGAFHSAALTTEGRVFTWGLNRHGRLGDGTTVDKFNPIDITNGFNINQEETIICLSLGNSHSSALTSDNRFFAWGLNNEGQLGDGTTTIQLKPIEITLDVSYKISKHQLDFGSPFEEMTRSDYLFSGWYLDEALTNQLDFDTMPAEDLVLYGRWIPVD